MYSGQNSAQ